MITGDLDLERTVWDVEYRRQVIAFLADQNGQSTKAMAGKARRSRKLSAYSAKIIPFPKPAHTPAADLRRAAES